MKFTSSVRTMAVVTLAGFLLTGCVATTGTSERSIERNLRSHIETLSSDEFEGRFPGTRGEELTVAHQIEALKSYGFEPGYIGQWTQPVTLERASPSQPVISIAGEPTTQIAADDLYALSAAGDQPQQGLEVIAVDSDFDGDLGNLAGKAVLFDNLPPGAPIFGRLIAANPAAILIAVSDEERMQRVAASTGQGRWDLPNGEGSTISLLYLGDEATAQLADALGKSRQDWAKAHEQGGGMGSLDTMINVSIKVEREQISSANVIGRLAGTKQGSGAVILLAHWDHLGDQCGDEGDEDRICNGAVDNASGIAAMLETARIVSQGPRPERDLYIMGNTAEELGLLGARAFVNNPPVPLDYFVAGFSLDTLALASKNAPITIIGAGLTPLDDGIKAVAEKLGREMDIREEDQQFARRHDGWMLTSNGVPAPLVSSSFGDREALADYLGGRYHAADDEYDEQMELGGVISDVPFYVELVRYFGNTANYMPPENDDDEETTAE